MKKRKIKLIVIFFLLVIIVLMLFLGFKIFKISNDENESNYKKDEKSEKIELSFSDRVSEVNAFSDERFFSIGWLQVQGTNIDFPILNSNSSKYETEIDYSYGWRSPNYNNGENREVLIGHNIINVSSTPMLSTEGLENFEALMSFSYYSFAKDNLYIQYTKDGQNDLYLIYGVGFYDYSYDNAETLEDDEINEYISSVKKNSIYDYDVDVNNNDILLTIKTCTRYFGNNEKQQFVIDARKVREEEEIIKYSVEINSNFEKLINNYEKS